ncbi:GGDEF domain-containing protein [Aquihabitans sp. McL0605]|uniref:GGDEF domain-containing protein n=1 Tax=Aquihabitans sp. McL0605 TaxID=3415671 RepID=UPI003CE75802
MVLASPVSAVAQWRSVILFTVVAATIGQTIHRLVQACAELLEHITELARRDALTGLANRRTWDERFPEEVERASRHALPLAVALLDLDHFKAYNDEHGHQRGDVLLEAMARSWSEMLRTGDLLARWGGEEFALLMPATDVDEAAVVLERLQDATPEGQTFSAGYTVERFHPGFEPDLDQVLRAVDQAMYVAKASGRARSALAVVAAIRLDEPLSAPLAPAPAPG